MLIKVSENKRFLVYNDGTPFFWLGDTAWELFHNLNREEAVLYLENRKSKGINVIQAVALAEYEGVTTPNAYGRLPLLKNKEGEFDPRLPDVNTNETDQYSYWDHVDYIIDQAQALGLYIGFLPTWGDKFNLMHWGKGPVIFTAENARSYGKWLGERYKDKDNIIWILGGDRPLTTYAHFEIIRGMAEGIQEGDAGRHLMTFHPGGCSSSSLYLHDEKWLDFNMIQSSHSAINYENYSHVEKDYRRKPVKPVLDGEPRYEDLPINFDRMNGYFDDYDVRQAAYWAVFSGAFGHTYGHLSIYRMNAEPDDFFVMTWKDALDKPGIGNMKHLKNLMLSRPFLERIPDQNLIAENYQGANHMRATRGRNYGFIYSPNGIQFKVNMGIISGEKIKASWFNPRNGENLYAGEYENSGVVNFIPPSSGRNNDWVLIIDDKNANFQGVLA